MRIRVQKGRLQELRGRKDFWSEVVFEERYGLAPTYTKADIQCLEQFLALEPKLDIGFAWAKAEPATPVCSRVFVAPPPRMPVSFEWGESRIRDNAEAA
jgi:hypothetical protein